MAVGSGQEDMVGSSWLAMMRRVKNTKSFARYYR